jgi:hypothetical protein
MEKQLIISIGREYGSAGHEIAEKVAKDLNLPLYDRHLLDKLAEEKGMNLKNIEKYDEKPRNLFLSRNVNGFSNSFADTVAEMQFKLNDPPKMVHRSTEDSKRAGIIPVFLFFMV